MTILYLHGILTDAKRILYIADNAGEIVFDRLFISQIVKAGKSVGAGCKIRAHNKRCYNRGCKAGRACSDLVEVIETGNNCIGTNFDQASKEFLKEFEMRDIIISKGQGNFESLDEIKSKKIFFLLKAKCEKIARELNVDYLDVVFMKSRYYQ